MSRRSRPKARCIAAFADAPRRDRRRAARAPPAARRCIMPDALLDEVTALVEWPAVYAGTFDPAFLAVPQECLILTMQQNQKYFALADADGTLVHRFLLVSQHRRRAIRRAIVHGNERVLRARLADAKFFFDQDRKTPLGARVGAARERRLSQQARHAGASASSGCARSRARIAPMRRRRRRRSPTAPRCSPRPISSPTWSANFPSCRASMGRYYAQHDGEPADGRRRDRAALLAALRGRCAARRRRRAGGRARRQARSAGRHVRHRPGAHRRQGSVRPAPRGAGRDPHPRREAASPSPLARADRRSRSTRSRRTAASADARDDAARRSSTSACAATCASRAIRPTRSPPSSTARHPIHLPDSRAA